MLLECILFIWIFPFKIIEVVCFITKNNYLFNFVLLWPLLSVYVFFYIIVLPNERLGGCLFESSSLPNLRIWLLFNSFGGIQVVYLLLVICELFIVVVCYMLCVLWLLFTFTIVVALSLYLFHWWMSIDFWKNLM